MSDFKRIVPSEIPALCVKLNIAPWRGSWFQNKPNDCNDVPEGKECLACAVGIQAVAHSGVGDVAVAVEKNRNSYYETNIDPFYVLEGLTDGFTRDYLKGLSDGWEYCYYYRNKDAGPSAEYDAGREDGKAARTACVEDGIGVGW